MVKLPQGDLYAPGVAVSGSKTTSAKTWKYCPYSTQITNYNQDSRVPSGEKVFHSETDGRLHVYSLRGGLGWVCADNDCSYFTGSATTEVIQQGRRFVASGTCVLTEQDLATLSGSVQHLTRGRTIVSGTRYHEI
jgi:hypothetical protein